jgi:magnesium chelatase family protein
VAKTQKLAFVQTATLHGVEALPVTCETSVGGRGLPGIFMVGLPDAAVREASYRVRLALQAAGFETPNQHIVINFAPSALRKSGSGFDLPIALAILVATGQIAAGLTDQMLCVGELSIDGRIRSVRGLLAFEQLAVQSGQGLLTGPAPGGVYPPEQLDHHCLGNLADLHEMRLSQPYQAQSIEHEIEQDFAEVAGSQSAKRALQIAALGNHALMMVGPPGSGKSMLAARFPTILPKLSETEKVETAMVHSVAGLPYADILAGHKPFRAPHHSASRAGLLGGGSPPSPGEVSLAHNGVLFLDEMPEFGSAVLQLLRQPLESGQVALARAGGTTVFPARFHLLAAANPCPCGYLGDPEKNCRCTSSSVERYQSRIGGPLMDRFDLVIRVWRSPAAQVLATGRGQSSAQMRTEVEAGRLFRSSRLEQDSQGKSIGQSQTGQLLMELPGKGAQLLAECQLGHTELDFLEAAANAQHLSGRKIMKALAVARTIADLEQSELVGEEHLLEALSYRADVGFEI